MRRAFSTILLALLLVGNALGQSHAALVTDLSGSVTVARASGGSSEPASLGMQLFEGDEIRTGSNSRVSMLFSSNIISLGANGSMTITGSVAASSGATTGSSQFAEVSDLTLHRAGEGEISALGGLRSGGDRQAIQLLTPRNSRSLEARPHFAWHATGEFDLYRVRVMDESGVIWSAETEEMHMDYPDDAPDLQPDTEYLWQIEGEEMLDAVKSSLAPFQVLAEDARAAVTDEEGAIEKLVSGQEGSTSRDFMLGALYAREGLLGRAVEAFSRVVENHPDAAIAHEILGNLYDRIGLKDESIDAFRRAIVASNSR